MFLFSTQIWGQRYLAVLTDDIRAVHQYPSLLSSRLYFPTLFFTIIMHAYAKWYACACVMVQVRGYELNFLFTFTTISVWSTWRGAGNGKSQYTDYIWIIKHCTQYTIAKWLKARQLRIRFQEWTVLFGFHRRFLFVTQKCLEAFSPLC